MKPAVVKARRPRLAPSVSVAEATAKMIRSTGRQVLGNLDSVSVGAPEGLHQVRVGLRRYRAIESLFEPHMKGVTERNNHAAKQAFKALGPARDLDVFLHDTLPALRRVSEMRTDIDRVAELIDRQRARAYREVRKVLADGSVNRFATGLLRTAEPGSPTPRQAAPMASLAPALLAHRHRKLLKTGRNFETLTAQERHKVRIALKYLRYACDYLQDLYPGRSTRQFVTLLENLQDELGLQNDRVVALSLVGSLNAGGKDDRRAIASVEDALRRAMQDGEPRIRAAWARFTTCRPFWPAADA